MVSGQWSLKEIACRSTEILSSMGRAGGKHKTPAQTVAGAYFKVLKGFVELEVALAEAGVSTAPPAASSYSTRPTVELALTVPLNEPKTPLAQSVKKSMNQKMVPFLPLQRIN